MEKEVELSARRWWNLHVLLRLAGHSREGQNCTISVCVGGSYGGRGQDHFVVCSRPTSRLPVIKNGLGAFEGYFKKY